MDTNIIAIRHMQVATKTIARLFQLHVSLVVMVTHGHDGGAYARYTTDLLPKD